MTESPGVLLLDDGELDSVVEYLKRASVAHKRVRGGEIEDDIPAPAKLLITTPRHASKVGRGSPPGARPGRPVRIIVVEEDSPSMRKMLRSMGFHMLVRQTAHPEVWRLLIQRALYQGEERRREPRLPVGSEVSIGSGSTPGPSGAGDALLVDISNRAVGGTAEHLVDGTVAEDVPGCIDEIGIVRVGGDGVLVVKQGA